MCGKAVRYFLILWFNSCTHSYKNYEAILCDIVRYCLEQLLTIFLNILSLTNYRYRDYRYFGKHRLSSDMALFSSDILLF
jgi:hypothetical protein